MRPALIVRRAADYLSRHDVESPLPTAEILLANVLGTDRAGLYTRDEGLSAGEAKRFGRALCRRCVGVPLQHLTGEQGFRRLTLVVKPGVFIPRPETEILVEHALAAVADVAAPVVVDVGTGTGAIALAIKDERPDARVLAIDVSHDAVALARENAARCAPGRRGRAGDLLDPVPEGLRRAVDLVVSNPPYVEEEGFATLPRDVLADPRVGARRRGRYLRAALRPGVRGVAARRRGRGRDRRDAGCFRSETSRPRPGSCRVEVHARSDRPGPSRDRADAVVAVDPIADAVAAVRRGELIVFPTDTVYGIGADPHDPAATARLFDAKRRPRDLTLPVLTATLDVARTLARFDDRAERLATALWPGPLTLVLPRSDVSRTWDLGREATTIGLRVPSHPLALAVLSAAGPLATTSANRSGSPPAVTCDELHVVFGDLVAVYLCEERPLSGAASTVVDLSQGRRSHPSRRRRATESASASSWAGEHRC